MLLPRLILLSACLWTCAGDSGQTELRSRAPRSQWDRTMMVTQDNQKRDPSPFRSPLSPGCEPLLGSTDLSSTPRTAMSYSDSAAQFSSFRQCLGSDITDLMIAVKVGDREMVDRLLRTSADVNARSKTGWTALMEAVSRSDDDMAQALIRHGADVNAQSDEGITPLQLAASGSEELVAGLIAYGADVNAIGYAGQTALMIACANRRPGIAKILLNHHADINKRDALGRTALIHAAFGGDDEAGGDSECMSLLLDFGADPNVADSKGHTALMGTAFYGDLQGTQVLIERGANVNAESKDGLSPLGQAHRSGHEDIVQVLQRGGGR